MARPKYPVAIVADEAPPSPDDDLKALLVDGKWKFVRKDGTPY